MSYRTRLALVGVGAIGGCGPVPLTVSEARHPIAEPVQIRMRDGTRLETTARPDGEGHGWLVGADDRPVPVEQIASIEHIDPSSGVVTGLGVGAGVGALAGFVLAGALFDSDACDQTPEQEARFGSAYEQSMCFSFGWLEPALLGGLVGLGLGVMTGAAIGATAGGRTIYRPQSPERTLRVDVRPGPNGGGVVVSGAF